MDNMSYKVNEAVVLAYLTDASQKVTFPLYNGKIYNEMFVEKKAKGTSVGFEGKIIFIYVLKII